MSTTVTGELANDYRLVVELTTPRFSVKCSTAEHYYQALRFDYEDAPEANRALVQLIGRQSSALATRVIGSASKNIEWRQPANAALATLAQSLLAAGARQLPNDDATRLRLMRATLKAKFDADIDARAALLDTGNAHLVYDRKTEPFWHAHLGGLLMELRASYEPLPPMTSFVTDSMRRIADDARRVRETVAAQGARNDLAARLGVHLYPRSLTYHVDPWGHGTDIYMYGGDVLGRTVAVRVTGYEPYMFVRLKQASVDDAKRFVSQLERALVVVAGQQCNGSIGRDVRRALMDKKAALIGRYDIVDGVSMKASGVDRGFNNSTSEKFIQIFFYAPSLVKAARDLLEYAYEHSNDRQCALTDLGVAEMLVDGVRNARARAEAATPDTDVKGRVRNVKKASVVEQRLVDEAQKAKRTLFNLGARKKDTSGAVASPPPPEPPKEDANAWNDLNVDVDYDDSPVNNDEQENLAVTCTKEPVKQCLIDFLDEASALGYTNPLGSLLVEHGAAVEVYEADIDFTVRYCIDAGFKPEECVQLRRNSTMGKFNASRQKTNSLEFSCDYRDLYRSSIDEAHNCVPSQVCMSFDCEMELGPDNAFPRPDRERILQACCVFFDPVADRKCEQVVRRAFVIGRVELDDFTSDEIFSFRSDTELSQALAEYIRVLQPDMLTGWNIENFDLNYLFARATHNTLNNDVAAICRRPGAKAIVRERQFASSAHGTHVYKEVSGEGLWVWDLYQAFKRSTSFKLRSYSLEYVSNTFLGDRKEDVAYSAINGLQTSPGGRAKLMRYCMKDALLPARLIGHLTLLIENIEMSRMAGVPLDMICRRGLQIRLKSFLYRKGRYAPKRHLFYTRTQADRLESVGASYAGAHVETPSIGYHDEAVVTLDFKSLYPSIMVTFAMCLKTLIPGRHLDERKRKYGLGDDDLTLPERNALPGEREDQPVYVRSSHTRGMVPDILTELLDERKRVKKMKAAAEKEGDSLMASIYDKRQLAIKLNCNSIYGVFGAPSSFAYCPEIAAMVTAFGRDVILETKALVERVFTIANGAPFNATVVYGDTDSVFVKLTVPPTSSLPRVTVEDSAVWGELMARFVTLHFIRKYGERKDNIIELEFEKTFSKIIFYAKKRYVGWKWILKFIKRTAEEVSTRQQSSTSVSEPLEAILSHVNDSDSALLQQARQHTIEALANVHMVRKSEPDASGMETERRDSCLLVSRGVKEVINILLDDSSNSRTSTLERVRDYIVDEMVAPIESGTLPWNDLIQSKQFRMRLSEYTARGQTPPVHIKLAAKLDQRLGANSPGTYQPGDRIQYVVVEADEPGRKTSECGEDPDWAWKKRMRLSREHYIERQVHATMTRVLEPILLEGGSTRTLADFGLGSSSSSSSITAESAKRKRQNEAKRVYASFLQQRRGKRQRLVLGGGAVGLERLASGVEERCRLCGALGTQMCSSHTQEERASLTSEMASKRRRLDNERQNLWRTCTSCTQGWRLEDDGDRASALGKVDVEDALEHLIACKNSTCDVYWRRRLNDRMLE